MSKKNVEIINDYIEAKVDRLYCFTCSFKSVVDDMSSIEGNDINYCPKCPTP